MRRGREKAATHVSCFLYLYVMNFDDFQSSLSGSHPPAGTDTCLEALWYEGKGDWEKAHELIQHIENKTAARIHAYLHRKEGDTWNANYWYGKAGRRMPGHTPEKEWELMVKELLEQQVSK